MRHRRIFFSFLTVAAFGLCLALPANAALLDAESINSAEFDASKPPTKSKIEAVVVKAQVLLDRARFSPGEIDGKLGENAQKALKAFAESTGMSGINAITPEVWKALIATTSDAAVVEYKISNDDVKGPFLAKLPAKMEEMKNLPSVGYTSPREALAEKFHMSEELLAALNPRKHFDRAGETIAVIDTGADPSPAKAAKVEVDKNRQAVRLFDKSNALIGFYPATVGSEEKPSPVGTLKVTEIDRNPTYYYHPEYHFKGVHSREPFTIKPGPNNPVGSMWINLSGEGYGIHGTPFPGKVSKSESHGCVRLTNWDAERVAERVSKGTPVTFVDDSK